MTPTDGTSLPANPSLRVAVALGFVGFVTSFGAHIVAVNLPTYAKETGIGLAMIGLLIAVYDLAEVVAKPVFGAVADRRGMKQTMLVGIAIFTGASLLFPLVDPRLLIVVRFLQGVGAAALSAVSLALVGVYYRDRRGRAYGAYNAVKGAGYVLAPIVGGGIVVSSGFAWIFVATAGIGAVAFVVALLLPPTRERASLDDDDDDFSLKGMLLVFREPRLIPWFAVTVVNMFFVGILFGFLPVRLHDLGYSALASGVLLTVVSASYLLVQPLVGSLADRWDVGATIRIGLIAAALSIIAAAFLRGPVLVAAGVIAGLGVGTVWTNTDALVSDLADDRKLGATMGAAGSYKELGDMLGPLLIGARAA